VRKEGVWLFWELSNAEDLSQESRSLIWASRSGSVFESNLS